MLLLALIPSPRLIYSWLAGPADEACLYIGNRLFSREKGNTQGHCCGAAVNMGTTILASAIVDLNHGIEIL